MREADLLQGELGREQSKLNPGYYDFTDLQVAYKYKHPTARPNLSTFSWEKHFPEPTPRCQLAFSALFSTHHTSMPSSLGKFHFYVAGIIFVEINYFLSIFLSEDLIHLIVFYPHPGSVPEDSSCYHRKFL